MLQYCIIFVRPFSRTRSSAHKVKVVSRCGFPVVSFVLIQCTQSGFAEVTPCGRPCARVPSAGDPACTACARARAVRGGGPEVTHIAYSRTLTGTKHDDATHHAKETSDRPTGERASLEGAAACVSGHAGRLLARCHPDHTMQTHPK